MKNRPDDVAKALDLLKRYHETALSECGRLGRTCKDLPEQCDCRRIAIEQWREANAP